MRDKIRSIIAEVFRLNVEDLPASPDPDNIERWDSLGHLKLITRLGEEFHVDIPQDKLIFMTSEDKILSSLKDLGVK